MKRYLVISVTTSVNGSRRYEKEFNNYKDAHKYATARADKKNVVYIKILYYRNIGKTTCCDAIWEHDKDK